MSTEFDRDVVIRAAVPTDAEALSRLYNHYVEKTHVTFEEDAIIPGEMARRIQGVADADFPWIVGERSGRLVGYAYVCPWRPRKAYRFSAEATVYIDPALTGQGIGAQLYGALLPSVAARGIHAVVGVIALPMTRASACTSGSASRRWRTSTRSGSSSGAGSTWTTGS